MKLDHENVQRFYETEYYGGAEATGSLPWHTRLMARRLEPLKGAAVLDVACGTGRWLELLARRGARPSGIDISATAIGQAQARMPQADLRVGVGEDLPFEDASFDLVTCMGSLEHFLDQGGALKEMRRVARANARILILVPNAGFLTRRLGLYKGTQQVAIRETVRPIREWEALFADAGLSVEKRWRDLHPLSLGWIGHGAPRAWPLRAVQALALAFWPIAWQYQVHFLCRARG